jgi:hypothetical protein
MGYGSAAEREFEEAQGMFGGPQGNEPGGGDHGGGGGGEHGGYGGLGRAGWEALFGAPSSPPPGMVEIAGPPLPGTTGPSYIEEPEPEPEGDLFNDHYDPEKYAGAIDPAAASGVRDVSGGFLTNDDGFFGFREKLVEDPVTGSVKSAISWSPTAAAVDVAAGVAGAAIGGPLGMVASTVLSRLLTTATSPGYTLGTAARDAIAPRAVRNLVADPGYELAGYQKDLEDFFASADSDYGYDAGRDNREGAGAYGFNSYGAAQPAVQGSYDHSAPSEAYPDNGGSTASDGAVWS